MTRIVANSKGVKQEKNGDDVSEVRVWVLLQMVHASISQRGNPHTQRHHYEIIIEPADACKEPQTSDTLELFRQEIKNKIAKKMQKLVYRFAAKVHFNRCGIQ